jgi:hypothetical protein
VAAPNQSIRDPFAQQTGRNPQLGPVLADLSCVPINQANRFSLPTSQRHRLSQRKRGFFIQRIELETESTQTLNISITTAGPHLADCADKSPTKATRDLSPKILHPTCERPRKTGGVAGKNRDVCQPEKRN